MNVVQVWDNAAFDDNNGRNLDSSKCSWSHISNPLSSINLSVKSFESDCSSKENLSPVKTLRVNNAVVKNQDCGVLEERHLGSGFDLDLDLDLEIEVVEKEISRLLTRLESLRLEKAKKNAGLMKDGGRVVSAKGVGPTKEVLRRFDEELRSDKTMSVSGNLRTPRRGVSVGPAEIMRAMRREITPVKPSVNRRMSCYWKLQDVDELRVAKERGKTMSLSPKSRCKTVSKPEIPKKAVTTIGSKKMVKKDEGVISSIQPKKLFVKDGEKSVPSKKPLKGGRVVASRYNQITSGGSSAMKELRKRSWPDNDDDMKKSDKKRLSLGAKSPKNVDHTVAKILEGVPRIKTCRSTIESPRYSGPAKRVSELVGKKSFFSMDDRGDNPDDELVCQALDFEEEYAIREYPKIRVLRSVNESPRDSGAAKRVSQLVGKNLFFVNDDDDDVPAFDFEDEEN